MRKVVLVVLALLVLFLMRQWYLPLFLRPDHDFLYATGPSSWAWNRDKVEAGKLVARDNVEPPSADSEDVQYFVYDVRADVSRPISFHDARQLDLVFTGHSVESTARSKPSNGFQVSFGAKGACVGIGFICDRHDLENIWLEGWSMSRRLSVDESVQEDQPFHFLGWIAQQRDVVKTG